MEAFIHGCKSALPSFFEKEEVTHAVPLSFEAGHLELDVSSPLYPKRSDQKIMRTDNMAAVMIAQELLNEAGADLNKEEMGLFVASGAFIENVHKHLGHLIKAFEKIKKADAEEVKLKHIYRASPPLLALQTLTNSTMSFVAQYTGLMGNNATFGNTSLSGFHAIEAAVIQNELHHSPAMALASNIGGAFSFIQNVSLIEEQSDWKESTASCAMIISEEKENALAKITQLKYSDEDDWANLIEGSSDALIHSGAYTKKQAKLDQEVALTINENSISLFNDYGNLGSSNVLCSIDKGIQMLQNGLGSVDILDRDIYGRSSYVKIEKVG